MKSSFLLYVFADIFYKICQKVLIVDAEGIKS